MNVKWLASKKFEDLYSYNKPLGCFYTKSRTTFVLWAPTAEKVYIALYGKDIYENTKRITKEMNKGENGVWTITIEGDLKDEFYTYLVNVDNKLNEVVDPYARAVSVNGEKSMVVNLEDTNPLDWDKDKRVKLINPTDAIIYEVHIRDLTMDYDSELRNDFRGKYKGFVEEGTKLKNTDIKTGFDHIKELGVTHVHLLPSFDYGSIDETDKTNKKYNWGYDPQNYNVPEGSYSTNPYSGEIRIKEFKEMVKKLHDNNIGVVMDMVYNHTYNLKSCFNLAVPGYYYRQDENGEYSNGSGCGNETASERYMFRKYMMDSVVYWAKEYHIDGFRFDLMGLHDIETMLEIRKALDKISKHILIYGEGWTCNTSPLDSEVAALKENTYKYGKEQIAVFSDDARDGIKGKVFYDDSLGFANGGEGLEETIKFMVTASTYHPQIDISKGMYSKKFWANEPYQTVTYDSAHDNYTLFDKLKISQKDASIEELIKMNKLVAATVLTSQGITFLHAGEEIARSKKDEKGNLIDNSFNKSDSINKIRWRDKERFNDLYQYYRGLIKLRKSMKSFRMTTNEQIVSNIKFIDIDSNVVAYKINSRELNDIYDEVMVIINANDNAIDVSLDGEQWVCLVNGERAGIESLDEKFDKGKIRVAEKSLYVLVRNN